MASVIIGSTIAGTIAKATGRGHQGHLQWSTNDAAWWLFYISSADTTHLLTYRSPDGVTWTAKSSYAFESSGVHNSNAQNFSVAYKNISSNDCYHVDFGHQTSTHQSHNRGKTSAGAITWGTDAQAPSGSAMISGAVSSVISDNNFPYGSYSDGNLETYKATNADTGTAWTAGFGTIKLLSSTSSVSFGSVHCEATSSNRILYVYDSGNNASTFTVLNWDTWDGTTAGTETAINSAITAQDKNDWGMCRVSDTDIHVVYRTGSNSFTHKRWNGTNFTSVAGATIPSQVHLAASGIALVSDGTNVWMIIISSAAGNAVMYLKWTAGSNTWDAAWSTLEATSQTRNYITASPNLDASGNIGVIWTQTNGSNFDIVFETLSTTAAVSAYPYLQKSQRWDQLPDNWQEWTAFTEPPYAQWYIPARPPTHQPSQRWDPLPDFRQEFPVYRMQPLPITYLPPPPLINPQRSQRFDPLPDQWQEWEAFTEMSYAQWYVPQAPLPRQASQRIEPLPDWWQEWSAYTEVPYAQWYIPAKPSIRQPSQLWDPLPDLWQEWEAFTETPYAQWYVPQSPLPRQASQRWDPLLDTNDQWYRQHYVWPVPVQFVPSPIPTHQLSQQLYYDLPNNWQEWEAFTEVSFAQWYIPAAPLPRQGSQRFDVAPAIDFPLQTRQSVPGTISPGRQTSQRIESLPDLWQEWEAFRQVTSQFPVGRPGPAPGQRYDIQPEWWQAWQAFKQNPYAQWYVPTPPPGPQPSQRWDGAFDYNEIWWRWAYHQIGQFLASSSAIIWAGTTNLGMAGAGTSNLLVSYSGATNLVLSGIGISSRVIGWAGTTGGVLAPPRTSSSFFISAQGQQIIPTMWWDQYEEFQR